MDYHHLAEPIYELLILARLRLVLNFRIFPSSFSVDVRRSDLDATIVRKKMYCPILASDSVSHETHNEGYGNHTTVNNHEGFYYKRL